MATYLIYTRAGIKKKKRKENNVFVFNKFRNIFVSFFFFFIEFDEEEEDEKEEDWV